MTERASPLRSEDARGTRKPLPPHWYKRYITECPVCGRGRDERVRQLTPRPDDPGDRVEYDGAAYDWCMETFA